MKLKDHLKQWWIELEHPLKDMWIAFYYPTYAQPAKTLRKKLAKVVVQGNNEEIHKIYHELFKAHYATFNEDNFITLISFMTDHFTTTLIEEATTLGVFRGKESVSVGEAIKIQIEHSIRDVARRAAERKALLTPA